MRVARIVVGFLVVGLQAFLLPLHDHAAPGGVVAASSAHNRVATPGGVNGGYPRLANYNGFATPAQIPFFSGYNLVVAQRGAAIGLLHAANPGIVTLLYERTLQADLCCMGDLYGLDASAVPPRWWLLGGGSHLSTAITANQRWIFVADPRPFAPCQDVLVDGESMHVWAVQGHRLNVLRGYESAPTRHRAGARIAPHVSYRIDLSNCTLSGPTADPRPWSLNLSSRCPRWHGLTWADYLARRIAYLVRRDGWSGVFYDNLNDLPFSPQVDTNDDGHADGGIIHGVNVWEAGERALLAETRALLPGRPLLINGDLRIVGLANGREMEGFPAIPGLALAAGIDAYVADAALGTPRTIVNPDTQGRSVPSQDVADLAVGVSLLGDGYATYDRGWQDHGDPWWFDSFDRGSGAPLRFAVGPWTAELAVPNPFQYRVGATVLIGQEAAVVTGITPHALLVERGMDGSIASPHDAGTRVTTPWQRLQGHGYLGLPRGPAQPVATAPWDRYILPRTILRIGAGGRTSPIPGRPQGAAGPIVIRSTMHYDPDVSGLVVLPAPSGPVLRTLSFTARGPAGAQLWITAGTISVPVVLRKGWYRYALPIWNAPRIAIGTGRVAGQVFVGDVHVYGVQALVWRRDFTYGTVLVNPTDRLQQVSLDRPSYPLSGGTAMGTARHSLTCRVTVAQYRALILLNGPPRARCTAAHAGGAGTRTGTPVASPTPHPSTGPSYVVTTGDGLHLRQGPSLDAPILETLPLGTRLAVRGDDGEWLAVTAPDGTRGYVLRQYVAPAS